jgi:RNA polymerase sigma-70 factor (ECF subfamily)
MAFTDQLALSRSGDRTALEGMFAPWRPLLRLQARRLLGAELCARVDPSDVVQEALTQAFQDLDQFRGGTEQEWLAWPRVIVAGHAAKARRHHAAEKRAVDREGPLPPDLPGGSSSDPAACAINHEEAARLAAAIETLPEDMRQILLLRLVDQEPFDRAGPLLGRSPGAARVLWTRALRRLRQTLAAEESSS